MTTTPHPSAFREMPDWLFDLDEARPVVLPSRPPSYLRNHKKHLQDRFFDGGAQAMPDYELLELILYRALPRADVKPIAAALIEGFGDFNRVISAPISRLLEVEGMDVSVAQE